MYAQGIFNKAEDSLVYAIQATFLGMVQVKIWSL